MVPDSPPSERPRHLAAVWMADVVGFSSLASSNEDRALHLIEGFQVAARTVIERHGGRLVKFIGDAALAEFSATAGAVRAAADLRVSVPEELRLRVGIHVGDVMPTPDGDILGDGVNLAARLQTAAAPGQVLVSEQAWHQLRHREGFSFVPAGLRQLKGQTERLKVWEVIASPSSEAMESASDGQRQRAAVSRPARHALHPSSLIARVQHSSAARIPLMVIGAVGILVLGGGLWWASGIGRVERGEQFSAFAPSGPAPTRLAVLYFDDHSPGNQLGYLADGLTEALIHELSQVEALEVISRNGVKPYRDAAVPIDSIVRALGVGSLVEGSVAESGGRVRVTVQLIDGGTGAHLSSNVVTAALDDVFNLEEEVLGAVVESLRRDLGERVRLSEVARGTESREAYELVLRAINQTSEYYSLRGTGSTAALRRLSVADSLLEAASRVDPGWPRPLIEMGRVALSRASEMATLPGQPAEDQLLVARQYTDQALGLEEGNLEAFELRGVIGERLSNLPASPNAERYSREAESDLQRVVAADPGRAEAWLALSRIFIREARFAEATFAAEQALAADAFLEDSDQTLHQIYYSSLQLGPNDAALEACNEGRRRFPLADEFVSCRLFILASFPSVRPDIAEAWRLVDTLRAAVPIGRQERFTTYGRMLVAQTIARAGLADSAASVIRATRGPEPAGWLAYNEAHARILMGQDSMAVELLRLYLAENPNDLAFVAEDWWFSSLSDRPEFIALVGQ